MHDHSMNKRLQPWSLLNWQLYYKSIAIMQPKLSGLLNFLKFQDENFIDGLHHCIYSYLALILYLETVWMCHITSALSTKYNCLELKRFHMKYKVVIISSYSQSVCSLIYHHYYFT